MAQRAVPGIPIPATGPIRSILREEKTQRDVVSRTLALQRLENEIHYTIKTALQVLLSFRQKESRFTSFPQKVKSFLLHFFISFCSFFMYLSWGPQGPSSRCPTLWASE